MSGHLAFIEQSIRQSIELKSELLQQPDLLQAIADVGDRCIEVFRAGNRVLLAGNGGSAADAQHIAAEFVCRFLFDRPALPSLALGTNYSVMTAAANDYDFDAVFAREIEAQGRAGDLFIGITTSGNSANILRAVERCRELEITSVGLCGAGGAIHELADHCIAVPSKQTPRIQECHILIGHILCEIVETALFARA